MEEFRLSTLRSENTWFGCLVDSRDRLVASAFGPSSKIVQAHLISYSKQHLASSAVFGEYSLPREMARLHNGRTSSNPIRLNTDFVSDFQRRVYAVLEKIPKGRVTTYGSISKHLASAPRPVGGAVASNPWPLFVPCHRVVNFDLSVGNFSMCGSLGQSGTSTKRSLLEREGVHVRDDQIDRSAFWNPSGNKD